MTITQLNYIIAIDNFKNFSEAAKNCFVTQPTLSMQIKKLEEEINAEIFKRHKQPVEPTDIGKKIIDQARIIIKETLRIDEIINNERNELRGTLKIGIIPTIAPYLLPLFIKNFIKNNPKINLIIDELQTQQIIDKLLVDKLDAAIIATPANSKMIFDEPLYYEPFIGYVSKSHKFYKENRIDHTKLNIEDIWLLNEGHCLRDQVIQLCNGLKTSGERESNLSFEGGTLDTLMKLVENNFGMTLLPYLTANELKNTKRSKYLREFNKPIPKRQVSIVYHKAYLKKKMIEALKDEITGSVPQILLEP